jgi:photoactive yellow protein
VRTPQRKLAASRQTGLRFSPCPAHNKTPFNNILMGEVSFEPSILCAWCGCAVRQGTPAASVSCGICLTCLGDQFAHPIERVASLDDATADRLPFGFIRMDAEGRLVAYNSQESALSGLSQTRVLGRNFFRTIAPCTCVEEFEGTLQRMIASEKAQRTQIEFLFKFNQQMATMVDIAMTTDPSSGYATLLIRKTGQESQ